MRKKLMAVLLMTLCLSVILAGTEVLTFAVHAECIPCSGTENILFRYIVHAYGYAKH